MSTQVYVKDLKREFISKKGFIKKEKTKVEALKGISFDIQKGEIFGLLGENGAGKTTTIKILTTLLLPTSGEVNILGFNPVNEEKKIRPLINFVFGGERSLYWRLSARENLNYFSDLYKIDDRIKKKKIDEVLEIVKLTDRANEKVETYSKGMKQRLQIARGLINDPEIIFLDEPTIGLDPVGAMELRTTIRNLQSLGKTLLLTTHYMYEADDLCDRIGILKKGEMICLDTPSLIKAQNTSGKVISVETYGVDEQKLQGLKSIHGIDNVHVTFKEQKQVVELQCKEIVNTMGEVLRHLKDEKVLYISPRDTTLEDTYIQLMGGE
jgi:ABC-2 type transport system ATP-binding protein